MRRLISAALGYPLQWSGEEQRREKEAVLQRNWDFLDFTAVVELHRGQKSEKVMRECWSRSAGLTEEHIQFANYSRVDAIGNEWVLSKPESVNWQSAAWKVFNLCRSAFGFCLQIEELIALVLCLNMFQIRDWKQFQDLIYAWSEDLVVLWLTETLMGLMTGIHLAGYGGGGWRLLLLCRAESKRADSAPQRDWRLLMGGRERWRWGQTGPVNSSRSITRTGLHLMMNHWRKSVI